MCILMINREALGGLTLEFYWTSTEFSAVPTLHAFGASFDLVGQGNLLKDTSARVRCVRVITP